MAMQFENELLAQYPRPLQCIHDQGREVMGPKFQRVLYLNGIKDVCTTTKNPQSNAICEQMHQTVGNILRTYLHMQPLHNQVQAQHIMDSALASATYATRCAIHRTL